MEISFKRFYMKLNNGELEIEIDIMGKVFYLTIENKVQGLYTLFESD